MNRAVRFAFALWLVAAGSIGSPQPCGAEEAIGLRGETEVTRASVKLSDLFTGVSAEADPDIAQAPPPGKKATYNANVLMRLAQKYRLDWKPRSTDDHVVIAAACTCISGDALREAVAAKLKSAQVKGEMDVVFDNRGLEIALPAGTSPSFKLENFDFDPLTRRFRTHFDADTARGPFTMVITGRVSLKRSIPVLARRLEGGTVISAADIDWLTVPEEHVNGSVATEVAQLIGRELRHTRGSGELLHAQDVIPPRLITRGGLVTLKIETPFMLVTAQGKALQDGAQGETVRVTNTQSNRVIEGVVDGPGTVIVHTTQKIAAAQ
ncbi:MAG: flagellar basal body P-ring formation chaperone FlgA [Alphaproteobacteria bacterium]|nr:flagellar basal body P-ring formation chaperone FlgA [Alphaproteobacteria bacterium]